MSAFALCRWSLSWAEFWSLSKSIHKEPEKVMLFEKRVCADVTEWGVWGEITLESGRSQIQRQALPIMDFKYVHILEKE